MSDNRPKPPIRCIPCRVKYNNEYYRVYADGSVSPALSIQEARDLGLSTVAEMIKYESDNFTRYKPDSSEARTIRREASRLRRNRNARDRNQAMRDLGMVKTPYGWE